MDIQYLDDGDVATFNGRLYRRDKRTGYYLASKPSENGRRERLHVAVWKYHNGDIPEGYQIHHIDHDKSNNEISNLQCISKEDHAKLHGREMSEERRKELRQRMERIRPLTKAWHKSEEGLEWHRNQMKKQWENKKPEKYICTNCGKEFESLHRYKEGANRFCRNACKAAYRRKSGVDDITIKCPSCNHEYKTNRYQICNCPKCGSRI